MTRRCKDCKVKQLLYAAEQSEQEASEIITELKQDLALFRQAHDNEQAQRRILEAKLEKIKEIVKCSKKPMNCDNCPMCEDCEELCVNDENLQDIILQITEGAEE